MDIKTILFFWCLTSAVVLHAQEITLYDNEGKAVAYIDANDDDIPIYLWNGTPVAYLEPASRGFHIYGFNGKHLGWYEDGVVRDHSGHMVGFKKGAVNIYTSYEPYKSYKQYKPYKSYQQYAPYKPYFTNILSTETLSLFLRRGK